MHRFVFLLAALFILAAAPATAQTLTIVSGDGQHAPRESSRYLEGGMAQFAPLRVALRDAAGKGIANAPVTFRCNHDPAMACQLTPPGTDNGTLMVKTNSNGIASLDQMLGKSIQTYYQDGSFTVTASYRNRAVTFNLSMVPPKRAPVGWVTGATLTVVAGANQRVIRRTARAHFGPMAVRLVGPNGKPVAHAPIHFNCGDSVACQLTASGVDHGELDVMTDGNGVATLDRIDGGSLIFWHRQDQQQGVGVGTHTMRAT
ncbi:MAG TPA: hypothetical protein VIJ52_05575, partial [Pseudolabrys sp.]